jgi:SPX domain protein involved in polyphosphate accumulation
MQRQRFELKYIINEETALKVRDFVSGELDMDEYSVGRPNYSYPVHSLYIDSDDLRLYWETINGNKNRYKLRLRFYTTNPDAPVFFEIKRRMNNIIMKQRGGVRQEAVAWLLDGQLPTEEHLVARNNPKHLVALQRFCQLMCDMRGKPKVHICYEREAYVSDDDTVRVTLDRHVMAEENLSSTIKTEMEFPVHRFVKQVILELKFTNRFPNWFRHLVHRFNVMQCGAAKYISSVEGVGRARLDAWGSPPLVAEAHDLCDYS